MDLLNKFTHAFNDIIEFEEIQASSEAEDNVHGLQFPLTNDGFDIDWKNLIDRYENKRM